MKKKILDKGLSLSRYSIFALFALISTSCSVPCQKPVVVIPPAIVADILPDYEIKDVRELPQEFGTYVNTSTIKSFDKACRDTLLYEFRRKYYAPWSVSQLLSNISGSILIMQEHTAKDWYGENKRKVPRKILDELLANCDLDRFPAMNSMAIAIVPTSLRVLPTTKPFLETANDFPFDALQNAGLKMNEPLRVLHVSADGLWAFAETADANGWVPLRDIGFIGERLAAEWTEKVQVVIVKDFAPLRNRQEQFAVRAKLGTLFPLVGEDEKSYEVSVAVQSGSNGVREIKVRIPKDSARRFPLEVSGETVALIGNELIGKPYGWGEYLQGRDCSALLRDFYQPFGLWLPRGSYNQIHSGRSISFSGLSPAEKERLIREKGVPFLTIIYMKGHIMLYVGSKDGKALIFHALWKVKVKNSEGRTIKQPVGKAIVSTLTPGSELVLASGSLLDKVSRMLILSNRCGLTH